MLYVKEDVASDSPPLVHAISLFSVLIVYGIQHIALAHFT